MYAVLVAGVVSMSGILLANIIVKQLVLSSIGKETQTAYYAANAGTECAAYGSENNYFGKYDIDGQPIEPNNDWQTLACLNSEAENNNYDPDTRMYMFQVKADDGQSCADVKVQVVPGGNLITSLGVNYCDNRNHPRAVAKEIYRVNAGVDSI